MAMMPKRVKFRKVQKGRIRGNATRGMPLKRRNSPKIKEISSLGRVQFSDEKLNTVRYWTP